MQVEIGTTYDQVKSILGDGMKDSLTHTEDSGLEPFILENADGSYIRVSFLLNRVFDKHQENLENNMNAKITKEEFAKLKRGMTYEEVKSVLGEGQLIYKSSSSGAFYNEEYIWLNKDKSFIKVHLQENRVTSRYAEGLK